MAKRRKKKLPDPLMGAIALGNDPSGAPTGSDAFGGSTEDNPLRGALLFGNDPRGNPRGSDAFGGSDEKEPLRGALLLGNDPRGNPRGSDAFGGSDENMPLRGALLFGNDPEGLPRGALTFGNVGAEGLHYRGSEAFGAGQWLPGKLFKDTIGYDFGGVILQADENSLAGMKKSPNDRIRTRVLGILKEHLDFDPQKARQGLDEHAIKWGKLKHDPTMDGELARTLRDWYRRAPGERLGIKQVQEVLEETERMHTFELICSWDRQPMTLSIYWDGEIYAYAESRIHNTHRFFEFKDIEGNILGYADSITPHRGRQSARVRAINGDTVAAIELLGPSTQDPRLDPSDGPTADADEDIPKRFEARILDADGTALFYLKEMPAAKNKFNAELRRQSDDTVIGRVRDTLESGKVKCQVELDMQVPQVKAWALGCIFADLARVRRDGWPQAKELQHNEEEIESVRQALGPSSASERDTGDDE